MQIRHQGMATGRDRKQGLDNADEIRGRHHPFPRSKVGKLCLRAAQRRVPDQGRPEPEALAWRSCRTGRDGGAAGCADAGRSTSISAMGAGVQDGSGLLEDPGPCRRSRNQSRREPCAQRSRADAATGPRRGDMVLDPAAPNWYQRHASQTGGRRSTWTVTPARQPPFGVPISFFCRAA